MANKNDFVMTRTVDVDDVLNSRFRAAVNAYAQSVPNHKMGNLGDEVRLTSVTEQSYFQLELTTEYEERYADSHCEPWRNQKYETQPNQPSVWKYRFPLNTEEFHKRHAMIMVEETDKVKQCFNCADGKVACGRCDTDGQISCSTCGGHGQVKCHSCSGKGYYNCKHCNGSGTLQCNKCYGKRKIQVTKYRDVKVFNYSTKKYETKQEMYSVEEACPNCKGTGRMTCRYCGGKAHYTCSTCGGSGSLSCNTCSGKGRLTCPTCKGTRKVTCSVCEGKAQLYSFDGIHQRMSWQDNARVSYATSLKSCGEFYDKINEMPLNKIYTASTNSGAVDISELNECNAEVYQAAQHLQQDAQKQTSEQKRIAFQQLIIRRLVAQVVNYTYKGKTYVGVLFDGTFYPGASSPLSEHTEQLMSNGSKYLNWRMYPQAYHDANLADEMMVYNTTKRASELRAVAARKVLDLHKLGAMIALLLFLYLLIPALYHFYSHLNPVLSFVASVNDPNSWGYPFYPTIMCLLSAGVMIFGYYKTREPFNDQLYLRTTRFTLMGIGWGFLWNVLLTGGMLLVLMLLNALGLCWVVNLVSALVFALFACVVLVVVLAIKLVVSLFQWLWGLIF